MTAQNLVEHRDRRMLVLIALGVGVVVFNWFPYGTQRSSFNCIVDVAGNQQLPTITQLQKHASATVLPATIQLSAQTSCADTPPDLALFFNLPMPVNRADSKDLIMLPGIGPRMAERILHFRTTQGPISGPETLIQIKGIGPKLTEQILPLVCFE